MRWRRRLLGLAHAPVVPAARRRPALGSLEAAEDARGHRLLPGATPTVMRPARGADLVAFMASG